MPAWWKGNSRSKSSKAGAASPAPAGSIPAAVSIAGEVKGEKGKKKASSFDEALLAKGVRGKQQPPAAAGEVIGLPLPRPASLPSPLPSASASASASSGGGSSLGSSASDEQLDLGVYR